MCSPTTTEQPAETLYLLPLHERSGGHPLRGPEWFVPMTHVPGKPLAEKYACSRSACSIPRPVPRGPKFPHELVGFLLPGNGYERWLAAKQPTLEMCSTSAD